MTEADLMRRLQKRASELGARLFRQNVGTAWVGEVERFPRPTMVQVAPGDVVIRNARPFHAGVKGMSDLGGWKPVRVTVGMVGVTLPVCAQVEVKTARGRVSAEQQAWLDYVRSIGGIAGVARSEADLDAILSAY